MYPRKRSNPRFKSPAAWAVIAALVVLPSLAYGQTVAPSSNSSEPKKLEDEKAVELSPFIVTGSKDEGYRSTQTVSSSRTVESLRNTPNSISVLNRELMDDLAVSNIAELLSHSITGETSSLSQSPTPGEAARATAPYYEFRGLVSQYPMRDGILWTSPLDSYNIERVEILRGPNAFLYGESGPTGSMNQITKKPRPKNFTRVLARVGSYGMLRGELDVNHMLTEDFGLRLNVAQQTQEGPNHHVGRDFKGITLAAMWRPFRNTTIHANFEVGRSEENRQAGILADVYSLTDTRGTLGAVRTSTQTSGLTYLPASGALFRSTGQQLSTGTGLALPVVLPQFIPDPLGVYPPETNFLGPDSFFDVRYDSVMVDLEQKIGSNLTLQASVAQFNKVRDTQYASGGLSGGLYRDINPVLPNGSANPYFGDLYTEYQWVRRYILEPRRMARLTLVYNLELPFMTQKIIAQGTYNDDAVEGKFYSEFVNPNNPNFQGTLVNATNKAQADANTLVWTRNQFRRRFYLKDGDSARYTSFNPVPGVSSFQRTGIDTETDGNSGRFFTSDYTFYVPGWGVGASGTYWGGRVNTLVGWRRDQFYSRRTLDYFNPSTGLDTAIDPAAPQATVRPVSKDSYNYGIVVHPTKFVSLYANVADSVSISSSAIGQPSYRAGEVKEVGQGAGTEFGLRWAFLDGRLESNWTVYESSNVKAFASVGTRIGVRDEVAAIFGSAFEATGSDTHDETATGLEFETVANITKNWRLTWNISTNKLELTNRFPVLRYFQAEAERLGIATPLLDAFLAENPEGTPRFGYTKIRSNLITNYTFREGPLKNLSVGGSVQYRGKAYMGRIDLDQDTVSQDEFSPGYVLYNLFLGYSAKFKERDVRYQLNVQNLFDKTYYRTYGPSSGAYGEGLTWRFTASTEF